MARRTKNVETIIPEVEIEEVVEETPVEETTTKEDENIVGVAKTCVNIRKSADSEAEIVGLLYSGLTIKVLSKKKVSGFYKVEGGYINADYLDIKES